MKLSIFALPAALAQHSIPEMSRKYEDFDLALFESLTAPAILQRPSKLTPRHILMGRRNLDRNNGDFQQFYGDNCGLSQNIHRIVGGIDTDITIHPWQIYFQPGLSPTYAFQCGGSIISPYWSVSAAHCTNWGVQAQYSAVIHGMTEIIAGTVKKGTHIPIENWKDVATILRHPNYNSYSKENDIALVETVSPIMFNDGFSSPVCLPTNNFCLSEGTEVIATGWGTTHESGDVATTLQQVKLPMMGLANCDAAHTNVKVTQTMICAGGIQGLDACQGDSGGPLVYKDADNVATLLGATSWGVGCARKGLPGAYARVTKYLKWIEVTTAVSNDGASKTLSACEDNFLSLRTTEAPTTTMTTTTEPPTTTTAAPTTTTTLPPTTTSNLNLILNNSPQILSDSSRIRGAEFLNNYCVQVVGQPNKTPVAGDFIFMAPEANCEIENSAAEWRHDSVKKMIASKNGDLCWTADQSSVMGELTLEDCDVENSNQKWVYSGSRLVAGSDESKFLMFQARKYVTLMSVEKMSWTITV